MTARLFRLDSFEDQPAEKQPEPVAVDPRDLQRAAYDDGYAKGFTDGAARASQATMQQSEKLQSAIVEALSDAQIQLHGARARAEADLMELVSAIADTALSTVAAQDFADRVCSAIRWELSQSPQACLVLKLNPTDAERIADQMPEGIGVEADPELAQGAATICTDTGLTRLDTADVLRRITNTLSIPSLQKEPEYEQRNRA